MSKQTKREKIRPARIDFVIIAVNDEETKAAEEIFNLKESGKEGGLDYKWGHIDKTHNKGEKATVALVSFNDKQGIAEATTKTNKIVEALQPFYILILGTAGGVKRGNKEIAPGNLFISYIVKHGSIKENELREKPIMPPDRELYDCASQIHKDKGWLHLIKKSPPRKLNKDNKPEVFFNEMVSSDILIQELKNHPKLQEMMDQFPRIIAVDMEAGGVAKELYEKSCTERVPRYLVIKGISDIVDKKKKKRSKGNAKRRNQKERDDWRSYASHISAAFALSLISNFRPEKRLSTPIHRLLPGGLKHTFINSDCSGVINNVEPVDYSKIASYNFERICSDGGVENTYFFTVCAYDPKKLLETVKRSYQLKMGKECRMNNSDELARWTTDNFPHFHEFEKFAQNYPDRSVRILLLDDFDTWADEKNLKQVEWDFFLNLNGEVPCFAIDRVHTRASNNKFLTDYVILGNHLLIDYYDESSMLLVTDLYDPDLKHIFLSLKHDFEQKKKEYKLKGNEENLKPFRTLRKLKIQAKKVFDKQTKKK